MDQPQPLTLPQSPFGSASGPLGQMLSHSPFTLAFFAKILFFIWVIYTLIMYYHWWKYSPSKLTALRATIFYTLGSILIIGLMFAAA